MNRTKIEWCDYTWNPVTGCWGPGGTAEKPNRCSYCYAERAAQRIYFNNDWGQDYEMGDPFMPRFWPDRLNEPAKVKKPSRIFVCSMGDLFGEWVPSEWIYDVLVMVDKCPQHTFIFLTKNPHRYYNWQWPDNCWVGTTITNQQDADSRIPQLFEADCRTIFVSAEPLSGPIIFPKLEDISPGVNSIGISWLIIGAMTGPKAIRPQVDWVNSLVIQAEKAGIPIFVISSLSVLCYAHFITHRDFPDERKNP